MVKRNYTKTDKVNLQFRYLLWLYKTTKEELDKIGRKFTQLEIDKDILQYILRGIKPGLVKDKSKLQQMLKQWQEYIDNKQKDAQLGKFTGKKLRAEYYWLALKLAAIEYSVAKQLGKNSLSQIKQLYEQQMQKMILESKDH